MNKWQEQVREFCDKVCHQPISPDFPMIREGDLRARLIIEEATETAVALVGATKTRALLNEFYLNAGINEIPDTVEAIDGLCDLIYVALGTAEAMGIDLEPFFDAVHVSNMTKLGAGRNEHGKLDRRLHDKYEPPKLFEVLEPLLGRRYV